jgi:phenylpropionate dioxygenase-like ring-hydroxylating dioxygenase large terminal subunit
VCPYHGYEFEGNGTLSKVPGLSFTPSPCKNQASYPMVEKNGWLYMNTISRKIYEPEQGELPDFFQEEESNNKTFSYIHFQKDFKAYGRIVSENSLDVMHIGFVHTFGNKERPSPTDEIPPFEVGDYPYHYKTAYSYVAGKDSVAKKIYNKNQLIIENEFSLPHTTIARVIFGDFRLLWLIINLFYSFYFAIIYKHLNFYFTRFIFLFLFFCSLVAISLLMNNLNDHYERFNMIVSILYILSFAFFLKKNLSLIFYFIVFLTYFFITIYQGMYSIGLN